jgi:hypothetical protein
MIALRADSYSDNKILPKKYKQIVFEYTNDLRLNYSMFVSLQ